MLHKELDVWKKTIDLVTDIYKITKGFPDEEKFTLTSQLRRSAISIPSNIAEGAGRRSDKEFIQFLYIALGSAAETETQLIIASNINYLKEDAPVFLKIENVRKMILGLIKSLKGKDHEK